MPDRDHLAQLIAELKKQRDELAVRIHLGSQQAQAEWERVTAKLEELTKQYEPVKDAAKETGDNVWAALKLLGEEVRTGFDRIRKSL